MEGEEFDARAIAQAVLAKVKVAHEVEADPRSKPADQDSVKFRESDGSIRTVRATSLTPDDWAKLENAAILPSNLVVNIYRGGSWNVFVGCHIVRSEFRTIA